MRHIYSNAEEFNIAYAKDANRSHETYSAASLLNTKPCSAEGPMKYSTGYGYIRTYRAKSSFRQCRNVAMSHNMPQQYT